VSSYRDILQNLFTAQGKSHADIAKALGWDSPSTVGNKLRGERRTQLTELEAMAREAGITLVQLAALSDDLILADHSESVEAASIIDAWPEDKRQLAVQMLRAIGPVTPQSQE
jgi:transcriptional regulator with XRE-family HTH domain